MFRFIITVVTAAVLGLASSPPADASPPHRMPQPDAKVIATGNPDCKGLPCASPARGIIWLNGDRTQYTLRHELGHVFATWLDDTDKAWFTAEFGLDGHPWYDGTNWPDGGHSPDEFFADAFATCDLGMTPRMKRVRKGVWSGGWIDSYGYSPTALTHDRVCQRIKDVGLARDLHLAMDIVGGWIPTSRGGRKALAAMDVTIPGWVKVNDAYSYRVWDCQRSAPQHWLCYARLFFADGTYTDGVATVEPELTRRRRNNRWVGRWQPTGRLAVTALSPIASRQ